MVIVMTIARYGTQASVHYTRHMSMFHIDVVSSSETVPDVNITLLVPIYKKIL